MPKWWNALLDAFGVSESAERLDARRAVALVDELRALRLEEEAHRTVERALAVLDAQCALLRRSANGYPTNGAISARVWLDGAVLATCGDALADELARRGRLEDEDRARLLAVKATCEVLGHYPNEVFPRVFRRGQCSERLGRIAVAVQCYSAIVKDFEQLGLREDLLSAEDNEEAQGSERVILETVAAALERLDELAPAETVPGLVARIARRLRAPADTRGG
jgi:hypothetical protein